jgi:hypothetical protein
MDPVGLIIGVSKKGRQMLACQKGRQIFVAINMAPRFEISKYATGQVHQRTSPGPTATTPGTNRLTVFKVTLVLNNPAANYNAALYQLSCMNQLDFHIAYAPLCSCI